METTQKQNSIKGRLIITFGSTALQKAHKESFFTRLDRVEKHLNKRINGNIINSEFITIKRDRGSYKNNLK